MASLDEWQGGASNVQGAPPEIIDVVAPDETVKKIGMTFSCLPPRLLTIKRVNEGSVASQFGVEEGDVCFAINDKKVEDMNEGSFKVEMSKRPLHLLVRRQASEGTKERQSMAPVRKTVDLQEQQEAAAEVSARVIGQLQQVGDAKELADAIKRGQDTGVSADILANAQTRLAQLEKDSELKRSAVKAIEALTGLQKVLEGTDIQALSDSINRASKETKEAIEHARGHLTRLREKASEQKRKNLLEEYSMHEKLGEGTFGVVYACRSRKTNEEFAVKMVDKVESPLQSIMEEVQMMDQLKHPNIVRFVDVVYEKCFVCIVMDKFAGGNLVACMLKHWKEIGKLTLASSRPLCVQMANSIRYLHDKSIVHRDVKGDNYLTNVNVLTDPKIKVVLSDFGTAYTLGHGERLHDVCGTKAYWAPEFYDRNYGLKVDVWAVGVIVFAMIDGRFPFQDENEVRNSFLKLPPNLPQPCEHFVRKSLLRDEAKRLSAEDMATHEYLKLDQAKVSEKQDDAEPPASINALQDGEGLFIEGVNEGIAERRDELVGRLMKWYDWFVEGEDELAESTMGSTKTSCSFKNKTLKRQSVMRKSVVPDGDHFGAKITEAAGAKVWGERFELIRRGDKRQTYEWWEPEKVEKEESMSLVGAEPLMQGGSEEGSTEFVAKMLTEHNVDIEAFGKNQAKTLEDLAREVQSGVARLMLDATQHKKMVRVVDVVLLRIMVPDDDGEPGRFLVEVAERYPDGRRRQAYRLPGTKKAPHESTREATLRIVKNILHMNDCEIEFDWTKEVFEETHESPSYPGLTTIYRKEIIEGEVKTEDVGILERICLSGNQERWECRDTKGSVKFFSWLDEAACNKKRVQLEAPANTEAFSGLVQAPIGMKVDDLRKFLLSGNVDASKFGQNHTKTLKEFSQELVKGESSLMQDPGGRMIRVVDIVVLRIVNAQTGKILVQTNNIHSDGVVETKNQFPGHKRRPDENQFAPVKRILVTELGIDENCICIDPHGIKVLEEEKDSYSYPDLRTLYRKRIVSVVVDRYAES